MLGQHPTLKINGTKGCHQEQSWCAPGGLPWKSSTSQLNSVSSLLKFAAGVLLIQKQKQPHCFVFCSKPQQWHGVRADTLMEREQSCTEQKSYSHTRKSRDSITGLFCPFYRMSALIALFCLKVLLTFLRVLWNICICIGSEHNTPVREHSDLLGLFFFLLNQSASEYFQLQSVIVPSTIVSCC